MNTNNQFQSLSSSIFEQYIIEQRKPTVLVFGTEWSGNSEIMDSIVQKVSKDLKPEIQFFKVDIEKQVEIAQFFGVQTVPTIIMIQKGEVVDVIKGFISAKKIKYKLTEIYQENSNE